MSAGRNDPCPCGSGKKYKKCCFGKDSEAKAKQVLAPPPPPPRAAGSPRPALLPPPPTPPPPPPNPVTEKMDGIWAEFEAQTAGGRVRVFRETLEDAEMIDGLAYEMLSQIHSDALQDGNRARFAECVAALRERQAGAYQKDAVYYMSWCLQDALADGRQDAVVAFARESAALAGANIDMFSRDVEALEYHGQFDVLLETFRTAWSGVKGNTKNIMSWGIDRFAEQACRFEIYHYLEHATAPDPADRGLLDRLEPYFDDPNPELLRDFIADVTGKSGREWRAEDFEMKPPRKRGGWDDRSDRRPPDPAVVNLGRLIDEFLGYLRREEQVPFTRWELIRSELLEYFVRRHEGDLDPHPSMLEQAMNPRLKLPKPPRPIHPLCPERVTFDKCLGGMIGMLNLLYHTMTALFLITPAWLRFLESRRLIDAGIRNRVLNDLRPLHTTLLGIWKKFPDDPTLYRDGQAWPADAAKEPATPAG
ncbi:SEC-C metal-binding domain-containing protein [Fimbriiglobus ruber]|uniref:Protein export cytoplasm protein SecA ATPase RNA helicase n=1 Tax=Fimbriiglobus ruber TaxID=1908690 RepID=A0A225DJR7_9BACT|nr:SEC-C metal-binding domain-containing protein [Fimbriiglobus ruber]OWK41652.1 hypothetical protein FRUB_03730 [Fimbriiglobus ruber]